MIPSREKAEQLLQEGLQKNPGPWGDHSKTAAHCAEKIAAACGDLDPEKAYVLGLLHDIGRTFGMTRFGRLFLYEEDRLRRGGEGVPDAFLCDADAGGIYRKI